RGTGAEHAREGDHHRLGADGRGRPRRCLRSRAEALRVLPQGSDQAAVLRLRSGLADRERARVRPSVRLSLEGGHEEGDARLTDSRRLDEKTPAALLGIDTLWGGDVMNPSGVGRAVVDSWFSDEPMPEAYAHPAAARVRETGGGAGKE